MKNKLIICAAVIAAGAFAADFSVNKSVTKTWKEKPLTATIVYDAERSSDPVQIRVRLFGEEKPKIWTLDAVNALPDVVGGVTNLFKQRMLTAFEQSAIVRAYSWGLVDGRGWSMSPTNDVVVP